MVLLGVVPKEDKPCPPGYSKNAAGVCVLNPKDPVFGSPTPYTPPTVYQPLPAPPPIYGAGQPALDMDFRNSAPRTWDPRYGYVYTPAAKLLPATGAGMSWTPPSVTSRPRSLLNIDLPVDTGKPYSTLTPAEKANLRLSASQYYARDRAAAQQLAALPGGRFTGMQAPNVAQPLGDTAPNPYAVAPEEFRFYAPPKLAADGGEIKKSEGTADLSARAMLDTIDSDVPVKRNMVLEAHNASRARAGMAPAVPQDYSGRDLTGELLNAASLATAPVPVLGDIAGLAADARMYQMRPEERTMGNYALSALGVLPFVPSVSAVKTAAKGVKTAAEELAALTAKAPQKFIESLPGRNELNYWVDGGQDAVERGFPEEPFILFDKLYIDPQNRGQGAARKVLEEGLQDMTDQYPGMEVRLIAEPLDRSTNSSDLVRLYESVGFDVDNYQDGMSGIPMSMRLPSKPKSKGVKTETPEFKNFFGESKVVDADGKPLVVYRGLSTSSKEALNVGERKSYANFASSSPHVASSYANPRDSFDSGGPVLPLYIKADKLIEFPVKVSTYDGERRFDKFEFDRRAEALNPGEVLVVRQVIDIGPRASLEADPEKLFARPSDIYAWNKGVSVKSAIGNEGTYDITDPDITKADGGLIQKYATGSEVSSPKQTIEAIEPSLRDTIQQFIYDKIGGASSPEARARANRYSDIASSAVDWIPGVGDAVSASDALADYQRGNYGQAAIGAGLTALGAVPVVGDVAAKGVKTAAKELADAKLARAARQGYADQDFYHATKADITEFDADENKLGLTFLGTNPEFANQIVEDIGWRRRLGTEDMEMKDIQNLKNRITGTDYTQSDFYRDKNYLNKEYNFTDSTIYPLRTNLQNVFDPAQEGELLSEYLWSTGVDPQGYSHHWGNPIDESFEPRNLTNQEVLERGGWRDFENKEMIDFLKSKGFDSMWLRENYLTPDFKMTDPYSTLAKFDTSKIRSKFAEFDPEKLESRNIGHAKGGSVQKYATGSEVSSSDADLQAQMLAVGNMSNNKTPNAPTPNAPPPAKEQTDSAKFLAGLLGLVKSPRNIVDNILYHSFSELGGDLSGAAKNATAGLTDATFGMRDLAKTGGNWIGDKLMEQGLPLGTFLKFASNQPSNIPSAQEVKETLGVENADPYSPSYVLGSIGPSLLGSGIRGATTLTAKYGPQLAEELGAYVGGDTAANLMATLFPDSTLAQIGGSVVGSIGSSAGINAARNVDVPSNVMASLGDDVPLTDSAKMLNDLDNAGSPLAPQSDVPTIGATPLDFDKVFRDAGLLTAPVSVDPLAVGHGLPPILLVGGNNKKATVPVTQEFTPTNKNTVISNINTVIAQHPEALNSTQNWLSAEEEAFGGSFLPAEPSQAIIYNQTPSELARKLDGLTPKLKATVDEGFGHVAEIKNIYNAGLAAPDLTGRLFMWGILSRGAGPVQQEAAFLDIMDGASPFIDKAARGDFTEADIPAWNEMVTSSLPEGSPSKQVTMNANAAGRLLLALSHKPEGGFKTVLQTLHESLADPKTSGNDFRRKFFELTNKPGIDNKVVSFIGLVGGKTDLLVMDRIQSRHLWDNGKYEGKNIYDGINGTGLNKILAGPRGLMITEMLERGLKDSVTKAYAMIGRPQDASLARMHWETWLIEGNQGVSHSTLQNVRSGSSIGGGVTEGKPGTFSSGITYRQTINGSIVEYPLSDGTLVRMTPEKQKEFEMYIKDSKNGIVPKGFKVSDSIDKPWFERSEINREKLDNAAKQFENAYPDGTLRSGDVRPNQSGSTLSKRRGNFINTFRADQNRTLRGRYYASGDSSGNYSASSGPYRREGIAGDDGNGLLTFSPDATSLIQYNSAGLSVPTIRQVNAATDAVKYNADMTQAMSANPFGAQVEIKNPKELAGMRLFRTESGSGFGIKDDGDIVSIFSSANEPKHGSYAMLQAAVAAGGKKLDAFDTYLPNIYERVGFRPVARLPWNDDFAPPNWDKSIFAEYNNGKPDVIFFVYDPDYFGRAIDVPKITNFDDGAKLQNDALTRNVERQGIGSLLTEKLEGQSVNTDGTALTPVNWKRVQKMPVKQQFDKIYDWAESKGWKVEIAGVSDSTSSRYLNIRKPTNYDPEYGGYLDDETIHVRIADHANHRNTGDSLTSKLFINIAPGEATVSEAVNDIKKFMEAKARGGSVTKKAKGGNVERVYNDRKYI